MLEKQDIETLKKSFSDARLGVKVQSFSKDRTKAMLVLYLSHTDVADRLEEVDPAWSFEVIRSVPSKNGVSIEGRLTVKGVSRMNVGEGDDEKSACSDALKRCAMLFGVGRYLYDQEMVWVDYNEQKDRFRTWTLADYRVKRTPPTPTPTPKQVTVEEQAKLLAINVPGKTYEGKKLGDLSQEQAVKLANDTFAFLTEKKQRVPADWAGFFMAVEQLYGVIVGK